MGPSNLEKQVADLREQLAKKSAECQDLTEQLGKKDAECQDLTEQLGKKKVECQAVKASLEWHKVCGDHECEPRNQRPPHAGK